MKKFIIIDSHGLIHRAFHALPPLKTPEGHPIGAIYGLATMVLKIITKHRPNYIVAAFDRPEPTFRKEMFAEYKAQRPEVPPDLISQFNEARRFFEAITIPVWEKAGFEADDVIGTLVKRFSKERELETVILTGDLDTLQLVGGSVTVETPQKGTQETKQYDESEVLKRFGIYPQQLIDYKGLVGDVSDNIPGVPGIGAKTAATILEKFKTIESAIEKIGSDPILKKLDGNEKQALLSKNLATIRADVPLSIPSLEMFSFKEINKEKLSLYFERVGFQSLIKRLGNNSPKEVSQKSFFNENLVVSENAGLKEETRIAFDWKEIIKENPAYSKETLFDVRIAAWLLNPDRRFDSEREVFETYLKDPIENAETNLKKAYEVLSKKLLDEGLIPVFKTLEMPLLEILGEMEKNGILVDKKDLDLLHKKISKETGVLAEKIYKEAGERFNINSPQQVARVIFEKIGIDSKKKTPTGKLKTGRGILEDLKTEHPIIPLLLGYREYFKIDSGFVLPLAELVGEDGKIHTTYLQTGTATGRISSEKPNLQNIPQESRWSEEVRNVFKSSPQKTLVSFDYSQIELRLLAYLSKDEGLVRAFKEGKDIHTLTAMRVFGVPSESVTKNMRRVGKTLNFGVIYGMGPRSFAKTSGVSVEEAKTIIKNYFQNFPGVKNWQNKILENVRKNHYAENIHGRKRWFKTEKSYAGEFERAAINMPIQSLGADTIKKAMIETKRTLLKKGFWGSGVNLLLTIHDELLFEISDDILNKTVPLIKEIMESSSNISIPLVVEIKTGKRWGSMIPFQIL